jgi:hypothetical protein
MQKGQNEREKGQNTNRVPNSEGRVDGNKQV